MSLRKLLGITLAAFVAVGTVGATMAAQATPPNPDHKVTLCHRTGSATNPYIIETVDIASSGYVKGGHDAHEQVGNGLGGDIIPAYEYIAKDGTVFDYPGKNLDTVIGGSTGAEILANGCVIPGGEEVIPPVLNPAGNLTDVTCKKKTTTATFDNSASVNGSDENAVVQFGVTVNGAFYVSYFVPAGETWTVDVGPLADGDVVQLLTGSDGTLLDELTVSFATCVESGSGTGGHNGPTPTPVVTELASTL